MTFFDLSNPDRLPPGLQRPVVALGNFDGLHLGHQAVFSAALRIARRVNRPAAVLTFEPHPKRFFAPEKPLAQLTPPSVKAQLCAGFGLSGLIALHFDSAFAQQSADAFIEQFLVKRFAIAGLAVGHDFRFGQGRTGNTGTLAEAGKKHGFDVSIVQAVTQSGALVSSSAIRDALARGDVPSANRMLGYEYRLCSEVLHGRKLGRTIGYPTANIALPPDNPLIHGIYAVRVQIDGHWHPGVASFGTRPTFDNGPPLFETFLFDFDADLYGKTIDIAIVAWLRPEQKFDGIEPLLAQMNKDSADARRILAQT